MTRFYRPTVFDRRGPAPQAASDGLESHGVYVATLLSAPSGGKVKVVIPGLSIEHFFQATCSPVYTGQQGDQVLVIFDEAKHPWLVTPQALVGGGGSGGVAGVSSFAGRSGAVVPDAGDYTAAMVTHAADVSSASQQAFNAEVAAPDFAPSGLTGATAAGRYVGTTASGAPTSGTFRLGDWVTDQAGARWTCTTAGSPGSWTQEPGTGGVTLSGLAKYSSLVKKLSGLQHYWEMSEQSGTVAADSVGNLPLTWGADVSGFLTTGPDGSAKAPVNNGSTSRIAIASGYTPPTAFTLFWWERYDLAETDDGMIVELANSPTFSEYVQGDYNYSGSLQPVAGKAFFSVNLGNSSGAAGCYFSKPTATPLWNFLCWTFDASQGTNEPCKVFKNGMQVSSPTTNELSQAGFSPAAMNLGVLGRNNNGTRALPMHAALCGLGITTTILDPAQMLVLAAAIYN